MCSGGRSVSSRPSLPPTRFIPLPPAKNKTGTCAEGSLAPGFNCRRRSVKGKIKRQSFGSWSRDEEWAAFRGGEARRVGCER